MEDFKPDFGFSAPYRAKFKAENPVFSDPYLHRIAIMKDFHVGSVGDIDEHGTPGWASKYVCTCCNKEHNINGFDGMFHPDNFIKRA